MLIPCTACGAHHYPRDRHCPHCAAPLRRRSANALARLASLALLSTACQELYGIAVTNQGAKTTEDTAETGDTGTITTTTPDGTSSAGAVADDPRTPNLHPDPADGVEPTR